MSSPTFTVAKRGAWTNLVTAERLHDAEFAARMQEADRAHKQHDRAVRAAEDRSRRSQPRRRRHGRQGRVSR